MKSLKTIRAGNAVFSPEEFWKNYDAGKFKLPEGREQLLPTDIISRHSQIQRSP